MAGSELIHSIKITGAISQFIFKKPVVCNDEYPRAEIVNESFLCKLEKNYMFLVFLVSKWSFLKR